MIGRIDATDPTRTFGLFDMSRRPNHRTIGGLDGPIEVMREPQGVPRISARSIADALLGLGYCHAVDRGLQILMVRTLGRGEACLKLADSARMLEIDTFFKRLNFRNSIDIDSEYAKLSPEIRAGVDAYCRGVNLGLAGAGVPWELKLLGYRLENDPWTFADVVLTAKVIGYVGLGASQGEVERWLLECVQAGVRRELLDELFPGKLATLDEELVRKIKLETRVVPEAVWATPALPKASASNNWVISGSKSASGKPIVCNDPHLEVNRLPAVFYESILQWGPVENRRYAIGASVPGAPGVVSGRNADVAWAVTYSYMDACDSWVEDCRGGRYRRGDDWVPFTLREETIHRKKNPPVPLRFYETAQHGTLEGDPTIDGYYLATRWSNGEGTAAGSVSALIGMLESPNVEDGREKLAHLSNSSWCFVLGDRAGSIAYQMSGKMPIRRPGSDGLTPLPGWDEANDWRGFAAPEDLPRDLNPESGVLVSANDDLNHLGNVHPISLTPVPYRGERIREVLAGPGPFTVKDMQALQYDLVSTQARRFLPILREALTPWSDSNTNAKRLADWDCVYSAESLGASLFEMFYHALLEEVFTSGIGASGKDVARHLHEKTALLCEYYGLFDRVLCAERSEWFGARSRIEVYRVAVKRSGLLEAAPKPWGETRGVKSRHILFGDKLPTWLGFDRGPMPLRGGRATVSQGQLSSAMGYVSATGPSFRSVADLATDTLLTNLPGGPSDRRFSGWYTNDLSNWLNGIYKVLKGR